MKEIINNIFLIISVGAVISIIGFYIFNSKYITKLRKNSLCINLEEENIIVIDKYIKDKYNIKKIETDYNYKSEHKKRRKIKKKAIKLIIINQKFIALFFKIWIIKKIKLYNREINLY